MSLSPDGKLVAIGGQGPVHAGAIYDFVSRTRLCYIGSPKYWFVPACFSPDGGMLVGHYGAGDLEIINTRTGKIIRAIDADDEGNLTNVLFMPNGKTLITSGYDKAIRFWNAESGEEIRTIINDDGGTALMALSRDGSLLATVAYKRHKVGSSNAIEMRRARDIRLWDTQSGKAVGRFTGAEDAAHPVFIGFTDDNKQLVVANNSGIVSLWKAGDGTKVRQVAKTPCALSTGSLSRDGRILALGATEGTIFLYSVETGKPIVETDGHRARVMSLACSPDGKYVVTGGADSLVCLWDRQTGQEVRRRRGEKDGIVWRVLVSPDSTFVVSCGGGGELTRWAIGTGKEERILKDPADLGNYPSLSGDGRMLALANRGDHVLLLDTKTGKQRELKAPNCRDAIFSRDDKSVIAWSSDNVIHKWDVESGKHDEIACEALQKRVWSAAWSPDRRFIALASDEGLVAIADTATGKARRAFDGLPKGLIVWSLAFSADGRHLAWTYGEPGVIELGEVATGKRVARFEPKSGQINCLSFTPDGGTLISGSADTTALLWDVSKVVGK
jgi:WD40 repeat protein